VNIPNERSNAASKPFPRRTCNIKANVTRPPFRVTHGAGYQNAMVIKYSYGKHCAGFLAGEDVEMKGMSRLEVLKCADRTDCPSVNGDAILMAGYLCHPCIPNPCKYKSMACMDLLPYRCTSGFQCVSNLTKAKKPYLCAFPNSPLLTSGKAVVVADATKVPGLLSPVDVKFHPKADSPPQLWVANRGRSQMLVIRDPGSSQMSSMAWQDRAEYHYNSRVTALSFDQESGRTLVTCQNSKNDYNGKLEHNLFMGPTIYEIYPVGSFYGRPGDPVASISPDGKKCTKPGFPDCFLIHSDMLHESPMCMGTVHDAGAVTKGGFHTGATSSGHVYFYSDGSRGELMRFDAETLHGPGTLDHRTANIRRYVDIRLKPVDDVPGHMVLDRATRVLYVADPGNSRVLRVHADGGEFKRVAQCVPDECYPSHESYVPGTCTNGYCTGGRCLGADGYGCYHIFTETADLFEYELWNCSAQDDFTKHVVMPSGLALGNGRLYVGDYASGRIHVFDLSGKELHHLQASTTGLAGLEFKCVNATTCNLYFANALTSQVGMISIANEKSSVATKPLPRRVCNITGNLTRPPFNVTHGAGYQNPMVLKYSYGKHCAGFKPGEDVEKKGKKALDVYGCPDRTDCASTNGDAILMAGYLCHPCIPNPCKYALKACLDLFPFSCTPGFQCPSDRVKAEKRMFCDPRNQTIMATLTTTIATLSGLTSGVSTVVTLIGLDFDKVAANATVKATLVTSIENAFLASMTGYTKDDFNVVLTKGSVKATVTITPKDGSDTAALKNLMTSKKAATESAVLTKVKAMPAVSSILENGRSISDVVASSSAPMQVARTATDKSTTTATAAATATLTTTRATTEEKNGHMSFCSAMNLRVIAVMLVGMHLQVAHYRS